MKAVVLEKIAVCSVSNFKTHDFIVELIKGDRVEIDMNKEFGDFYQVKLSENKSGYILKSNNIKFIDDKGYEICLNSNDNSDKEIYYKERNGFVTAWLIFVIIVNAVVSFFYLFASKTIYDNLPYRVSDSLLIFLAILGIFTIFCTAMLFQWKKWGFWGVAVINLIAFVLNIIIGLGIVLSILGLSGIAILYGVLQIKKNNVSAWENLD